MAEPDGRALARAVGPLGLWTAAFEGQPFDVERKAVQALEAARRTLADAHPGRFVMGVGASHGPLVDVRGHRYERPFSRMCGLLGEMDGAPVQGAIADARAPLVLAALGPRMLGLAGERADGALTYLVTPEHTAMARETLGSAPALCVEQGVVLTDDVEQARRVGREGLEMYLGLPNYVQNWKRLGFDDDDVADGGSDRLVDAMVVSGDAERIAQCVREHHDAGADHVCLQVFPTDGALPEREWSELAELLQDR